MCPFQAIWGPLTKRKLKHCKGSVILVNDQRSATLSDKPKAGKEKVVSTRICGETSCNQILARFPLVKSPTKGLNVLYNPFRERTPPRQAEVLFPIEAPFLKRHGVSAS